MTISDRLSDGIRRWRREPRPRAVLVQLAVGAVLVWVVLGAFSAAQRSAVDRPSVTAAAAMIRISVDGAAAGSETRQERSAGYPLILWSVGTVSPSVRAGIDCLAARDGHCAAPPVALIGLQTGLAAGCVLMMLHLAWRLSDSMSVAVLAMLLTVASSHLGGTAGMVRGYVWHLFLLLSAVVLLVEAGRRQSMAMTAAAGAALGAAALLEPIVLLLVPLAAALAAWLPGPHGAPTRPLATAAALAGAAAVVHGALLLVAIRAGYDANGIVDQIGLDLGRRLAFVGLDRSSWLASLVVPVPWVGEAAAGMLPGAELRKLGIGGVPGSLVASGETAWRDALVGSGGSRWLALVKLAASEIAARPLAYLVSVPPVLVRGLFAGGGVIALVGLLHVPRMLVYARAEGRLEAHLLVVVPALALLAFNALLTGNAWWLNPLLPFVYAYAIAYVASGW